LDTVAVIDASREAAWALILLIGRLETRVTTVMELTTITIFTPAGRREGVEEDPELFMAGRDVAAGDSVWSIHASSAR
jgi:hypothetical protein